ncbi:MAG: hypothetical protein GY765_42655, partial [bacterium]|nr:hypothetical protein [bacterium]
IDIACGLNPLTLPWMQLEPSIRYQAWDIDTRMTALLNRWFQLRHPRSRAFSKDILVSLPENAVDMIFLFKTLPCLEQQEKGVTQKLLQNLEANYVVVSFPSKTLGGRTKGMEDYYDGFIVEHLRALRMEYFKLEYGNEVFYVIDKS